MLGRRFERSLAEISGLAGADFSLQVNVWNTPTHIGSALNIGAGYESVEELT